MPALSPSDMFVDGYKDIEPVNGIKLLQDRAENCAIINYIQRDGSVKTDFIPFSRPRILPEDIEMIKKLVGKHSTDSK